MSLFNDSQLFISARSPFARRVRIAFLEHQIKFQEKVFNVFEKNPIIEKYNSLRRVPVLLMRDGQEIIDSSSILNALYAEQRNSQLIPFDTSLKIKLFNWSGLAIGFYEKVIEYFLEKSRPVNLQDETVIQEIKEIIKDTLVKLEVYLENKKYLVGNQFSQADIDWGTAISYLQLRIPQNLAENYPRIYIYYMRLEERSSFKATQPPPP